MNVPIANDIYSNARPSDDIAASDAPSLSALVEQAKPLVLRGIASDWHLTEHARRSAGDAANYLKSFYNGRPSMIYRARSSIKGRYFYNEQATALNYDSVREPVDRFLNELLTPDTDASLYMASARLDTYFPALASEVSFTSAPQLMPDTASTPTVSLWIGNRSLASCHFDAQENIACCVAGRRRIMMFPPDQIANLYPGPVERTPGGQVISMVDFNQPDFEQFPRFELALEHAQCVELEPGDGVFIPSMWWHQVEGLCDFNILVNYWWSQAPDYLGSGMPSLYHAMLAIRDRPAHEKAAFKALFDYYVFGEQENTVRHIPPAGRGMLNKLDEIQARRLRALIINQLNK